MRERSHAHRMPPPELDGSHLAEKVRNCGLEW